MSDLTDKQKTFVIEYVRLFNATQAYINVYDVDFETAKAASSRMLTNVNLKSAINRLRKARLHDLGANRQDDDNPVKHHQSWVQLKDK